MTLRDIVETRSECTVLDILGSQTTADATSSNSTSQKGPTLANGYDSVCIISIIRLVVLSRLAAVDVTWNYVNSAIWSAAEPSMGVISACIPSVRPLVSLIARGTTRGIGVSKTAKSSAQDYSSGASRMVWRSPRAGNGDGGEGYIEHLEDATEAGNRLQWGHETNVRGGKVVGRRAEDEVSLEEMNVPVGGIRVKDELVVTSTDWLEYKDNVF